MSSRTLKIRFFAVQNIFSTNYKWADTGVCPYRANSKLSACSDSAVHIANEMKMFNPDIFPRDSGWMPIQCFPYLME
jgi:hypothetical protein